MGTQRHSPGDNKTGSGEIEVLEGIERSLTTHDITPDTPAVPLKRKTFREEESVTSCQILDFKMGKMLPLASSYLESYVASYSSTFFR